MAKERWVWIFIVGIIIGAWIATFIQNPNEIVLNPTFKMSYSIRDYMDYSNAYLPIQIFTWHSVFIKITYFDSDRWIVGFWN